jgi:hypothetical protein
VVTTGTLMAHCLRTGQVGSFDNKSHCCLAGGTFASCHKMFTISPTLCKSAAGKNDSKQKDGLPNLYPALSLFMDSSKESAFFNKSRLSTCNSSNK